MQIGHTVTAGADEVDVGFGIGVEPFDSRYRADTDDLTLLFEKCQIPVHSGLGDVRVGFLKHPVNHLC